jgi:hypothetical protein
VFYSTVDTGTAMDAIVLQCVVWPTQWDCGELVWTGESFETDGRAKALFVAVLGPGCS